jgi:hypothetical protein
VRISPADRASYQYTESSPGIHGFDTTLGTPDLMTFEAPGIDPKVREEVALRHVTEELASDFADDRSAEEVEKAVQEAAEQYADATVRDFVPSLTERDARERLAEEAEEAEEVADGDAADAAKPDL